MVPDSGVGAISADHEVEANLELRAPLPLSCAGFVSHFEPGFIFPKVCPCEFVVEKEGHIGHGLQNVKEPLVETATVDGEDGLKR
jgi:hypothetical protein